MTRLRLISTSKRFVTDEMIQELAYQTNLYSTQNTGSSIDITEKDIEKFMGVYFRMGLVKMPSQRSYWETYMTYDGVSAVMSRNKFSSILRNIHFVNNLDISAEAKQSDRLWKTETMVNAIEGQFFDSFSRGTSIC